MNDAYVVVFESQNIKFINITESLIDEYLKMINDIGNVGRMIGRTSPVSKEKELKWIRSKIEEKALIYTMIEKGSGAFIGNIELMDATKTEAELGIAITKEKQDKGYGTEAILELLKYAFNTLGLNKITLKAYPVNARAIHVYKKCGFIEYKATDEDIYMEIYKKNIDKDKYRVNPVKKTKKVRISKNLSGEDIDLLIDNRNTNKKKSICDTHEDGA